MAAINAKPLNPPPKGGNIVGMSPTKTKIGTNQVAVDVGYGEVVVPTFDQSAVRRAPMPADDGLAGEVAVARADMSPAERSAARRPLRLSHSELNALLGVSGNPYLADMQDAMGRNRTAAIEMPMANLVDTRDMLRDRLASDREGLTAWGDLARFESALAKLDVEIMRREREIART